VRMYVRMFACSSRSDKPIHTKLGMLMSSNQEEISESQNSESILISRPGEGGFCSSENKQDRRTAPRSKLFIKTRRLQDKCHNPEICPGFESR
jgi:hypothetical protein